MQNKIYQWGNKLTHFGSKFDLKENSSINVEYNHSITLQILDFTANTYIYIRLIIIIRFNKLNLTYTFLGNKRHKCDICGKSYFHQASFWNHKKYTCGQNQKYKCEFCGHSSKYVHAMILHLRTKHNRDVNRKDLLPLTQ